MAGKPKVVSVSTFTPKQAARPGEAGSHYKIVGHYDPKGAHHPASAHSSHEKTEPHHAKPASGAPVPSSWLDSIKKMFSG